MNSKGSGIVFSCAIVAASVPVLHGEGASGRQARGGSSGAYELHPYFSQASEIVWPEDGDEGMRLGEFVLPEGFRIKVSGGGDQGLVGDIEFVLIGAGSVEIDGVELVVDSPYYIATTEISNAQWAALDGHPWPFGDYEDWATARVRRMQFEVNWGPLVPIKALVELGNHLGQPTHPAMGFSYEEIFGTLEAIGEKSGMIVRLPGLAEWTRAMRAERGSRFWWGEDLKRIPHRPRPRAYGGESGLSGIHDVDAGAANPVGLYNVIGNAAELVMPRDQERHALLEAGLKPPYNAGIMMGGSAITGGGWFGEEGRFDSWATRAEPLVASWWGMLDKNVYRRRLFLARDLDWLLGVRPVIMVPAE